jgi:pilus assembly protein FimV
LLSRIFSRGLVNVNKRHLTLSVALALACGSDAALALGLGQLQVKSGLNQPLVAEIPIIASAPGEIDNLEVRLASPEAFERVGLIRPSHSTANLSFSVGKNARGQPVVLVTSSGKFAEPFLSFLIEADWGRGTITKEYTALIDPPYIAKAIIRPLEAPTVVVAPTQAELPPLPPETTVKLSPEPTPVAVVETPVTPPAQLAVEAPTPSAAMPEPVTAAVTPEPAATTSVPEAMPAPEPIAAVETPAPAPVIAAPEPAPAQAIEVTPDSEYGPVASGETLSKIAQKLNPDASSVSVKQMMMALLRANPDAFIDDNVNQLKRGAVMRIPGREEASTLSDQEASTLIAEQSATWNAQRKPVLQPTETVTQTNPEPPPEVAETVQPPVQAEAASPFKSNPVVTSKPAVSKRANNAPRLEIVPPSKKSIAAKAAQSGAASGAGGAELRAELTQAREEVAVRETQISELKSRVTDLESQEAKRQELIELQNSQLKALQDELAKRDAMPAAAATAAAAEPIKTIKPITTPQEAPVAVAPSSDWYLNPLLPYIAVGGALTLGGLIWLFRRRREPVSDDAVVGSRRISDDADFQASLAAMKQNAPDSPVSTTSVQPALDESSWRDSLPEIASPPSAQSVEKQTIEDPEWTSLNNQLRSKPQDLEAHLGVLRYHYKRDDALAFEAAANAMRAQVSTVLDPRWREAVVMGVILLPGNPLFVQSGWNTPRFTDQKNTSQGTASAGVPVVTPSFVKAAEAKGLDATYTSAATSWDNKPGINPEINTVTPIEEIGPFTEELTASVPVAEEKVEQAYELNADEGDEADLMVSDPASSTKIELASAYLDIGDVEGARSMLEEVVDHGSAPAKRLAQRLLKEIG